MDVDAIIICLETNEIFHWAAQTAVGEKKIKLLKAAPTRWLSHREASKRLVSQAFHGSVII